MNLLHFRLLISSHILGIHWPSKSFESSMILTHGGFVEFVIPYSIVWHPFISAYHWLFDDQYHGLQSWLNIWRLGLCKTFLFVITPPYRKERQCGHASIWYVLFQDMGDIHAILSNLSQFDCIYKHFSFGTLPSSCMVIGSTLMGTVNFMSEDLNTLTFLDG